jgi:hypothetical protein
MLPAYRANERSVAMHLQFSLVNDLTPGGDEQSKLFRFVD